MKRTVLITGAIGLVAALALVISISLTPGQLEPLLTPETPRIAATHLDVDNATLILRVPKTDPNGLVVGAVSLRIEKSDLDGLTVQQKQNLRAVFVKLLQLKGIIP